MASWRPRRSSFPIRLQPSSPVINFDVRAMQLGRPLISIKQDFNSARGRQCDDSSGVSPGLRGAGSTQFAQSDTLANAEFLSANFGPRPCRQVADPLRRHFLNKPISTSRRMACPPDPTATGGRGQEEDRDSDGGSSLFSH